MAPHRPSPSLAPDHPLAMDLTRRGPDIVAPDPPQQSMVFDNPPLALSGAATPETAIGRLIRSCSAGLATAAAFLLDRNAPDCNDADASLELRAGHSFENELRTGLRMLLVAVVLGGGWLTVMPLSGAVAVPGNLVVQSNVKTIQHPTGGVVAEIKVRNGMRVAAGDCAGGSGFPRRPALREPASLRAAHRGYPPRTHAAAAAIRGSMRRLAARTRRRRTRRLHPAWPRAAGSDRAA